MTLQHMIDEALGEIRVGSRLFMAEDDVIDHGQCGHQFGPSTLGQERLRGVRDFDYQQAVRIIG